MVAVSQLQSTRTLNNSADWAELWLICFNFKKYMHLGPHDMNQTYTMKTGRELIPIEKVDSENIRIFNGCEVLIENSITRVTVPHHEPCRVMPNSYPSDGICNEEPLWILFLAYSSFDNCI